MRMAVTAPSNGAALWMSLWELMLTAEKPDGGRISSLVVPPS